MSNKSIGDVLREIGRELASKPERAITAPIAAIVGLTMGADAAGFAVVDENIETLRKKMTKSYITMTMNRMRELQEIGMSVTVKFDTDPDKGIPLVIIGLKDGNKNLDRKTTRTESAQYKKGLHDGLDLAISFVPDFVDYSDDEVLIARRLLVNFRASLATLKERTE